MKKICFLLFLLCACIAQAQNAYRTNKDISYVSGSETDTYRLERCKLDIYYPENKKDFSTIVWFHGGGMEGGNKFVPKELREQGLLTNDEVIEIKRRGKIKIGSRTIIFEKKYVSLLLSTKKIHRLHFCFRSFCGRLSFVDSGNG